MFLPYKLAVPTTGMLFPKGRKSKQGCFAEVYLLVQGLRRLSGKEKLRPYSQGLWLRLGPGALAAGGGASRPRSRCLGWLGQI